MRWSVLERTVALKGPMRPGAWRLKTAMGITGEDLSLRRKLVATFNPGRFALQICPSRHGGQNVDLSRSRPKARSAIGVGRNALRSPSAPGAMDRLVGTIEVGMSLPTVVFSIPHNLLFQTPWQTISAQIQASSDGANSL